MSTFSYFQTCSKVYRADKNHFATVEGLAGGLFELWRGHSARVAIDLIESTGDMFAEPTQEEIEKAWVSSLSDSEKAMIESWAN
jgi:hypothetical protein